MLRSGSFGVGSIGREACLARHRRCGACCYKGYSAERNLVVSSKHGDMAEFSLPAPWGAPDSDLACDRCWQDNPPLWSMCDAHGRR